MVEVLWAHSSRNPLHGDSSSAAVQNFLHTFLNVCWLSSAWWGEAARKKPCWISCWPISAQYWAVLHCIRGVGVAFPWVSAPLKTPPHMLQCAHGWWSGWWAHPPSERHPSQTHYILRIPQIPHSPKPIGDRSSAYKNHPWKIKVSLGRPPWQSIQRSGLCDNWSGKVERDQAPKSLQSFKWGSPSSSSSIMAGNTESVAEQFTKLTLS